MVGCQVTPGGYQDGTPNRASFGSFSFLSRSLGSVIYSYQIRYTTFILAS
jgi:hypothetical protein